MKPIRSFRVVCRDCGLNLLQTDTLQLLVSQRKGVLHPYWIQLALYVPYEFAKRLRDELVANEWASPDEVVIKGMSYETQLTEEEIEILAKIELSLQKTYDYFFRSSPKAPLLTISILKM